MKPIRFNPFDDSVYAYLDAYVELHGQPPISIRETAIGMFEPENSVRASILLQEHKGRFRIERIGRMSSVWPVYCHCRDFPVLSGKWDRCPSCQKYRRPWIHPDSVLESGTRSSVLSAAGKTAIGGIV